MYDFEDILDRKNNGSKKWSDKYIEKRFPNHKDEVFPLFIADMDYKLPIEIKDRFNKFISNMDFGYFDLEDDFYKSIINWHKKINNVSLYKEDIIEGIGTITTLGLAMKAILNVGDEVVIFTPVYGPFQDIIETNGFKMIKEPLIKDRLKYEIDFNSLEERLKSGAKGILICNPHNPSGRVWTDEEVLKIVSLSKKYKATIFSDEIHSDLVLYNNRFISFAKYFDEDVEVVISTSPNKTFNLSGIGASYLLIRNENLKEKVEEGLKKERIEVNRIGAEFIKIAYEEGEPWLKELKENIEDNIEIVKESFKDIDVDIMEIDSSYLLWIKFNKINNVLEFVEELAKETGVLLETGSRFISEYEGFIRLNVGTSKKILTEGINRIKEFYKK